MKFDVEIRGLERWAWGDGDCVLTKGANSLETNDKKLIQALRDAHDAKVGLVIVKEHK